VTVIGVLATGVGAAGGNRVAANGGAPDALPVSTPTALARDLAFAAVSACCARASNASVATAPIVASPRVRAASAFPVRASTSTALAS
jgi:hypothetical protein